MSHSLSAVRDVYNNTGEPWRLCNGTKVVFALCQIRCMSLNREGLGVLLDTSYNRDPYLVLLKLHVFNKCLRSFRTLPGHDVYLTRDRLNKL